MISQFMFVIPINMKQTRNKMSQGQLIRTII
uniref:Uncharacterized protein n=1 Tax=Rhizophora mucronata TaxID=61149 RepID=A0A2P2QSA9_RHIMU